MTVKELGGDPQALNERIRDLEEENEQLSHDRTLALALVADIRAAVGDPEGKLMQGDLLKRIRDMAAQQSANPTSSDLTESQENQIINERDYWEEKATELATMVGDHFGIELGEHTSANCPVQNAMEAIWETPEAEASTADNKPESCWPSLSEIIHDMVVANQAAWIEWQYGGGAEAGMNWIENGLAGPGQIPTEDEPWAKDAQLYYNANKSNPFPVCHCGKPSSHLWMGHGACCEAHMAEVQDRVKSEKEGVQ